MINKTIGAIAWHDLTVDDATGLKSFYEKVTGWKSQPVSMGDYDDYNMIIPSEGNPVAGICHKKGENANLPSLWMIYINVENLDSSIEACKGNGGKVISGPKVINGMGKYCVIEDPAGACCALFEHE
ncbi:glyoxalase/bleomycin resistance protein/dioxygenase [Melioribacter roseus P3M-2]|uniref:Glyoxalase/bleomycin resistance protein/dioxygenase n=1 Tax=Melioribacter roseus (strain DSM 23840 / JCM 17771 / VKM B-2668 / P3M-2) TaxID=1191523 RepID=I6ZZG0_MELRP|nr:VOC family protein [Melioribacter roseus]AFN74383.1 glyoxalase/bleomycin resistance protein/dioxygenase [Melioribacter roseus P3M-2]